MEFSNVTKGLGKKRFLGLLNYAVILGVTSLLFSSCATHRSNRLKNKSVKEWNATQWQEIKKSSDKDVDEWAVYSRKVAGTTALEYKIEGTIHSTPDACLDAFKQGIHNQADDSKKYPTYSITDESNKGLSTYVIHNEPFPLKDTEMSIRYSFFNEEDGGTGAEWKEDWVDYPIPASKKLKRIVAFRGSWSFTPIVQNSCQGIKTVQFDPKKMPKWLFQPMVMKFLKDELKDIREMTAEKTN